MRDTTGREEAIVTTSTHARSQSADYHDPFHNPGHNCEALRAQRQN
ncbi:MAG TPA: hypothetical protein VL361_22200 [Candidatus Limnocylindrales bacterium]|nr:hypothetical protein [Candidatus Limnocylindrales bacterium]